MSYEEENYLQDLVDYALDRYTSGELFFCSSDAGLFYDIIEFSKLYKLRFMTPHKKHFLEDIKAGFYGPNHNAKCKEIIDKLPSVNVEGMNVASRHVHHLRTIINAPESEYRTLNSPLIETLREFVNGRNTFFVYYNPTGCRRGHAGRSSTPK